MEFTLTLQKFKRSLMSNGIGSMTTKIKVILLHQEFYESLINTRF